MQTQQSTYTIIMKLLWILVVLLVAGCVSGKKVIKMIKLKDFHREGPFIFLTKIVLGAGTSQVDLSYHKGGEISSQSFYDDVAIGLLPGDQYRRFTLGYNCMQKDMRFFKKQKMNFKQQRHGMKHFKIPELKQKTQVYFYLYSCNYKPEELVGNNEEIKLEFSVLNNGSHFDQNDNMLTGYVFLFAVWVSMVIRFGMPIANILSLKNPDVVKIMGYGGMVVLGTAYLYRLIHLAFYWQDGMGVYLFEGFYLAFKNIGEAVITTMLVAISWGWTIIHLRPNQYYIIIGVVSGLINIVSLILSSLTEEHEQLFHTYETVPGIVVLVLRVVVLIIFLLGIINSLKQSSGKIIFFIKKLGWVGGTYLACWPLTVLVAELFLPQEQHKSIITFVEEVVHMCACTLLCEMISNQESAYRKVSLAQDDNPLRMSSYKTR